jgi:hypothetical protein
MRSVVGRDEIVLQRAVELADQLIQGSVGGLKTLDPDPTMAAKCKATGAGYATALEASESGESSGIRWVYETARMRVRKNMEKQGENVTNVRSERTDGSGSETGSVYTDEGEDSDCSNVNARPDIFFDARRLFP